MLRAMRLVSPAQIALEIRTRRYVSRQRRTVTRGLSDPRILDAVRDGGELPAGYGTRMDERVVEFPWLPAMGPKGTVLDAGSTLNHDHVLDAFLPVVDALHIATFEPEPHAFTRRKVSYVYCDLRDLPYRDGVFHTVISSSTLDHVGADNTFYGASAPRAENLYAEVDRALAELRRVLTADGRMLVTVPYGIVEDRGWWRQFDREGVKRIARASGARSVQIAVYAYSKAGWKTSDLDAEAQARAYDEREVDDDGAPAARAVACLALGNLA